MKLLINVKTKNYRRAFPRGTYSTAGSPQGNGRAEVNRRIVQNERRAECKLADATRWNSFNLGGG